MNQSALQTFQFPEHTCIPQAQPRPPAAVTPESPATQVMTDLAKVKAATIEPHTTLDQAERVMINQGVRSLFVVSNFPCVDGLVTLSDLISEKPMRLVNERNWRRHDLIVSDVMTALPKLDALDYGELKLANVGQVMATFRKLRHSHLLVVQAASSQGAARIRGVISLTQLERQLGRPVMDLPMAA